MWDWVLLNHPFLIILNLQSRRLRKARWGWFNGHLLSILLSTLLSFHRNLRYLLNPTYVPTTSRPVYWNFIRAIAMRLLLLLLVVGLLAKTASSLRVKPRLGTWKLSLSKALDVMDILPPDGYHNPPENNNNLELLDAKTMPQVTLLPAPLYSFTHLLA